MTDMEQVAGSPGLGSSGSGGRPRLCGLSPVRSHPAPRGLRGGTLLPRLSAPPSSLAAGPDQQVVDVRAHLWPFAPVQAIHHRVANGAVAAQHVAADHTVLLRT